jgi:hypothetical protein
LSCIIRRRNDDITLSVRSKVDRSGLPGPRGEDTPQPLLFAMALPARRRIDFFTELVKRLGFTVAA